MARSGSSPAIGSSFENVKHLNPYVENELRKVFEARRNSGVIEYVARHVS